MAGAGLPDVRPRDEGRARGPASRHAQASPGAASRTPEPGTAGGGEDLALGGLLGEGGMASVFLARQRSLERDVAVKVPKAGSDALPGLAAFLGKRG